MKKSLFNDTLAKTNLLIFPNSIISSLKSVNYIPFPKYQSYVDQESFCQCYKDKDMWVRVCFGTKDMLT